jgi:Zn-dependent protease
MHAMSEPAPVPAPSDETLPEPVQPAPTSRSNKKSALTVGFLALLAKAKGLLLILQGLKFGKLLLTFGSMAVMIAVEAMRYGWMFGVGFVLLIFIHEMGHALAIKRAGLNASYPVFIPFVGAFISLKSQVRSPREEAEIALAGPLAGAVASAACAGIYLLTRERLFLALAYSGFFLNLFNMTPLPPLDGGRAAAVFSQRAWWIGLAVIVAMFALTRAPQLLIIGFFAFTHARRKNQPVVDAPAAVRREVAASFFGLCAFLAMGIYMTNGALAH